MPSHQAPALATLATLLLLPVASAEAATVATLQAASASWEDADLSGPFVALRIRTPLSGHPASASQFDVTAPLVAVEADTAEAYLETPAAVVPGPAQTTRTILMKATVQGSAPRDGAFLYLFPTGPVNVDAPCAQAQATATSFLRAESKVNTSRSEPTLDVSKALEILPCAGSFFTVSGSFRLTLWERDAAWTAQEGSGILWSGKGRQETLPGVDPRPFVGKAQQLYLHVEDGTFRIKADAATSLFLEGASLSGAALTVQQASGRIQGEKAAGRQVQLAGELDAVLARSQEAVSVQVGGRLERASVDGSPLGLAATLPHPAGADRLPLLLVAAVAGAVAVPALAVPALRRRRRLEPRHLDVLQERAEAYLSCMRYDKARPLTLKLLDFKPDDGVWACLHARVLRGLGQPAAALRLHDLASKQLHGPEAGWMAAENAFHAAHAAALLHEQAPAQERPAAQKAVVSWMRHAIGLDAALHDEFARVPELRPFLASLKAVDAQSGYA